MITLNLTVLYLFIYLLTEVTESKENLKNANSFPGALAMRHQFSGVEGRLSEAIEFLVFWVDVRKAKSNK